MTPTIATTNGAAAAGGAVRRKPARRANTAERRATHNAVERQRRETLNGRFLDLAALLPNLTNVRRPSKSAIVNSSIALVHTQRRLRAIASRELRALAHEAECLRREVNEWRMAHPNQPVPSSVTEGTTTPLETLPEPPRSADFVALIELEEVSEDEMSMNEQERIAYEMRGGDSGPLGASFEDGEDEFGMGGAEDDLSDSVQRFVSGPAAPSATARNNNTAAANRARAQSLSVAPPRQNSGGAQFNNSTSIAQLQMQLSNQQAQAQAAAALIPSSYNAAAHQQQQQQQMMMQQHQYAMQQQQQQQQMQQHQQQQMQMQMAMNGQGFFPPSFDVIAAAAANGQQQQGSESDAAKLAAWNAHLFSALAAQREHTGPHFPGQHQFHTPPSSGHGPTGPFGSSTTPSQFMRNTTNPFEHSVSEEGGNGSVHEDMDGGANTPSSRSSTSVSMPPSLSLSISGLSSNASQSSQSNSPSLASHPNFVVGGMMGMPSSLPSALASPLHNLSLSQSQGAGEFFGSAPATGGNWAQMQQQQHGKSPVGTPVGQTPPPVPMPVMGGGGGNGGNGYHQYPMMSIFI